MYIPPDAKSVPELMKNYLESVNFVVLDMKDLIEKIAISHFQFERIHPFADGNGRTGRMIINQQLINHGLLPITINKNSDYRQSFKRFDKSGDISQFVHLMLTGELQALERLKEFRNRTCQ